MGLFIVNIYYLFRLSALTMLLVILPSSCGNQPREISGPYTADWESLANYNEEPEWIKDAKFGIYFHWGLYSVPAFGNEWYPRNMHFEGSAEYIHHLETYGHPSEFGYHDFVPMFKAEHFDAEEWTDLFVKAGARFAGPVAEHHDGFAMWDSDATPWNSMDMGPKRDITGEMRDAITGRGLKFITTFHHSKNLQRYKGMEQEVITREKNKNFQFRNCHFPLFPGMPPSMDHPERNYLYGNIPEEEWIEKVWLAKLVEVVDNYQPDLIYFDSWLNYIPDTARRRFCAHYLNRAHEWNKEVAIIRKQMDLPLEVSIDDLEKSRKNALEKKLWMTDETISTGSWCYTENLGIKPSRDVLHVLIDIVSKNGVLLLNISPKADGTIPGNQGEVLLEIGDWLGKYGEAIYKTRPWYTFGEGPTKEPEGHFSNAGAFQKLKYSSEDIRYTTNGQTVYAIFLGKPASGEELILKAFSEDGTGKPISVEDVSLPGNEEPVNWELTDEGLSVTLPQTELNEMAVVLKIKASN
jgi:alpha-L-fucosidase